MKVIQLIQKLAQSSGKMGAVTISEPAKSQKAPLSSESEEAVDGSEYGGFNTSDHAPVDTSEGPIDIELLIRGLLSTRKKGDDLATLMEQIVRDMNIDGSIFLVMPAKIRDYIGNPEEAESEFGDNAPSRLRELYTDLFPLLEKYKKLSLSPKKDKQTTGKKTRVSIGTDTKEMKLARKHWRRVGDALRQYRSKKDAITVLSLNDFIEHIEGCVERGVKTKGHIHYRPDNRDGFTPFWLTV
jgi:hypothetical protein